MIGQDIRSLKKTLGLLCSMITLASTMASQSIPQRIPEPKVAKASWIAAQSCSQLGSAKWSLDRVVWLKANLKEFDRFHMMVGLWTRPDTITLDVDYVEDSLTVEHELLHYLLQLDRNDNQHPVEYFVIKCKLMTLPVGG